jgi:SAM-dependent methyltransferase
MSGAPSQAHIWTHFQQEDSAGVFQASHARHAAILRTIRRRLGVANPVVLNVGIGDGNFERKAAELGWIVYALDPDPGAVARLRGEGIEAKVGSIDAVPFGDGQFHAVVATEVLEHLTDDERQAALREIARMLKPDGYFLGTVPFREDMEMNMAVCPQCRHVFHRWGHTTSFDLAKVREELGPFFGEISCRTTAFVPFKGRPLSGKLKGLVRLLLARRGAAIAVPSLFFVAGTPRR